jgi:hypothetical protein
VVLDLLCHGDGLWIVPDEVIDPISPSLDRIVRSDTLVRTLCGLVALDEHILAHVCGRDVVAWRQAGLEEDSRAISLGDDPRRLR